MRRDTVGRAPTEARSNIDAPPLRQIRSSGMWAALAHRAARYPPLPALGAATLLSSYLANLATSHCCARVNVFAAPLKEFDTPPGGVSCACCGS